MIRYYGFGERLRFSRLADAIVVPLLKKYVQGTKDIIFTSLSHDDEGVDCAVTTELGTVVRVDLKLRSHDYGKADVALETWSVCFTKVGWTRDYAKKTDSVLWYWLDSGKNFWVEFPPLRRIFCEHWHSWPYRKEIQDSGEWKSECMFVPIAVIKREIVALSSWKTPVIAIRQGRLKGFD